MTSEGTRVFDLRARLLNIVKHYIILTEHYIALKLNYRTRLVNVEHAVCYSIFNVLLHSLKQNRCKIVSTEITLVIVKFFIRCCFGDSQ
jgi:hypothetical protein